MLNQIKNNLFVGWAAIFTVLFLAPNTYYVYHSFSVFESPYREIASLGVALIIATSILIYTLRKNFRVAKYYTIFEVSISAYYYISTIGWDWGLIPALGFTLILPISVYYYSREFDSGEDLSIYEKENLKLLDEVYFWNKKFDEERDTHSNKTSELQQECAHWISEYERAMQGWTNDVGIRDERISELTALNNELKSLCDLHEQSLLVANRTISNLNEMRANDEIINRGEKFITPSAVDEIESITPVVPVQPSKKKAPIKREKVHDQKSTE